MTSTSQSVDARELMRALEVLDAEQRLFLPTPRELRLNRLLLAMTVIFLATVSAMGITAALDITLPFREWTDLLAPYAWNGILLAMACLIYLNFPLLRKLWRLESLRRRHDLGGLLRTRFRADWRRHWGTNLLKILVASVGLALVVLPLGYLATVVIKLSFQRQLFLAAAIGPGLLALLLWRKFGHKLRGRSRWVRAPVILVLIVALSPILIALGAILLVPGLNVAFTIFPGVPLAGACVVALYLAGRGKQRLKVVTGLHQRLAGASRDDPESVEEGMEIPGDVYQAIAGLERNQIVLARQQSLREANEEDLDAGYIILKSHAARGALEELAPAARQRVDEAIFGLTVDPAPAEAVRDDADGHYRLAVSDTPVELIYAVEPDERRVRIYTIETR